MANISTQFGMHSFPLQAENTIHLYLKHAVQPQSEILLWISVLTLQMALALELLQHLRLLFMMMLNLYMVNTRSQPTVVCDHVVCKLTTHLQHCKL